VTLRHVSKFPPSPSGIGLYAALFETCFAPPTRVVRRTFDPDPVVTQRLRSSARALFVGLRGAPGVDLLHVELGGRSLAEFYFAVGTLLRRDRPWLVITCHDVPSIVGLSMMFTVLDRRGMRRVGQWLSARLGAGLERWVLQNTDTVFALTGAGATVLEQRAGRPVHRLGHILVPRDLHDRKDPLVLLPGYVSTTCPVADIVRVVADAPPTDTGAWRVMVGAGEPRHLARELETLEPALLDRVTVQGGVDEDEMTATYARAAVVLRVGTGHHGGNQNAASGPLSIALGYGCRVVTDDPRPGVTELAAAGLIQQTSDPLFALREAMHAAGSGGLTPVSADAALRLYGPTATAARFWSAVRQDALRQRQEGGS
jgi:hypothetical protein